FQRPSLVRHPSLRRRQFSLRADSPSRHQYQRGAIAGILLTTTSSTSFPAASRSSRRPSTTRWISRLSSRMSAGPLKEVRWKKCKSALPKEKKLNRYCFSSALFGLMWIN
ncbi:hypothetical protein PFISCL1PPCAC_21911, partial [Pristionchus fissidentatus]